MLVKPDKNIMKDTLISILVIKMKKKNTLV